MSNGNRLPSSDQTKRLGYRGAGSAQTLDETDMSDNERHRGEDRLQDIDRRIERMRDEKAERQAPERRSSAGAGPSSDASRPNWSPGSWWGRSLAGRWIAGWGHTAVPGDAVLSGAAAGMLNVWRMVSGRGMATGYFDEHRQKPS